MFANPTDHFDNSPDTWQVIRTGERRWCVATKDGAILDVYQTRRQAQAALSDGFMAAHYDKVSRWYLGERIPGWRMYGTQSHDKPVPSQFQPATRDRHAAG